MMMPKKGIDVSSWQGAIDWATVKPNIDFAIIRTGYGNNNIDNQFVRNANECSRLGIPFGVYWFSYALNEKQAKEEADYVCNAVAKYNLSYPICYDFEYDSTNYATKNGITITKSLMVAMAKAFLNRVEERGYFAALYSNPDYLFRGFSELINRYDLWLAHWGISQPSRSCGIWQYRSDGYITGIDGEVDMNYAYKDYPTLIANMHKGNGASRNNEKETKVSDKLEKLKQEKWKQYYKLAQEVWQGKWGSGSARKSALQNKGYDYDFVQAIVNLMAVK